MPLWDFECTNCNFEGEQLVSFNEQVKCPKCDSLLKRIFPNKTHFKLVYNNKTDICDWHGNTSQYWSKVKEEKAKGRNVKGIDE